MSHRIHESHIMDLIANSKYEIFESANAPCVVVIMTLPNGYSLAESSACVDPANYDREIGIESCKNALKRKVWAYEGYLAKQRLYEENA